MEMFVTGFFASMIFIFFKAFQQRNVAFEHYSWIIPTSIAMALAEFWVIAMIVREGYNLPLVITLGTGSGVGALAATYLHQRYLTRG
jgi:hypothetical protein